MYRPPCGIRWLRLTIFFCLVFFLSAFPSRGAEHNDLIKRVPESASSLIIVEAKSFFESPLAIREGWQREVRDAFATAPFLLPPDAARVDPAPGGPLLDRGPLGDGTPPGGDLAWIARTGPWRYRPAVGRDTTLPAGQDGALQAEQDGTTRGVRPEPPPELQENLR